VPVELRDDQLRAPRGGEHDIHADAETDEAVIVGQRRLDERHVDRDQPAAEQLGHLGQEDRRVVGKPPVHRVAGVRPDEEGVVAEVVLEPLVRVRRHAERPDVDDLRVAERLRIGPHVVGERVDEVLRFRTRRGQEDPVPPPDVPEDLRRRQELVRVPLLEPCQVRLCPFAHPPPPREVL
jgi:hypothetical protein